MNAHSNMEVVMFSPIDLAYTSVPVSINTVNHFFRNSKQKYFWKDAVPSIDILNQINHKYETIKTSPR